MQMFCRSFSYTPSKKFLLLVGYAMLRMEIEELRSKILKALRAKIPL